MKSLRRFKSLVILLSLLLVFLITFTSARKAASSRKKPLLLASVHLVDRNGFSESITSRDRLNLFQNVDFLRPQPYQKVLRIYARDGKGDVRSVVTSYHENGNSKQFLEVLNGRANGYYREWHENGNMSLNVKVINGAPDISCGTERTWVFDSASQVWDEEGHFIAEICYCQGSLEGNSVYFHSSGRIWKTIPYRNNEVDGTIEIYKDNGDLLQQVSYTRGVKEGDSYRYWCKDQLAAHEFFRCGKLECGEYFDIQGNSVAEIKEGNGYRAIFGKEAVCELQKYVGGVLDGDVRVFAPQGQLKRLYHAKNNIKNGEETEYYFDNSLCPLDGLPQPKLSFNWNEGKVHGLSKTWYPNGNLESQREMANNEKNGILTSWYRDGNLMLIEEYEKNKLIRGDYFRMGEKNPVSQVAHGKGTATIYDANGHFMHKIAYENGVPTE